MSRLKAVFLVVFTVFCVPITGQVTSDSVVCAVVAKWDNGGAVELDDLAAGTGITITNTKDSWGLNGMTRDQTSGVFYFATGYGYNVYKYDPCNGDTNVAQIGTITGLASGLWGMHTVLMMIHCT